MIYEKVNLLDEFVGYEMDSFESLNIQASILYKEILRINSIRFCDCIFIPMSIYNIISNLPYFSNEIEHLNGSESDICGRIGNIKFYLDFIMDPNTIIMTFDINKLRDNKISNILDGVKLLESVYVYVNF